jgi:hypothetical protein
MMTNYKKYSRKNVKLQEVLDPVAMQPTDRLTLPPVQLDGCYSMDCRDRRLLHTLQPAAGPPGEMDRSGPL